MRTTKETLEDAQAAFWAVIARAHPGARHGDLSCDALHKFDRDCATVVEYWEQTNIPQGPLAVLMALGFEEWSTGGGCTALGFTRPDGQQCMVTNDAAVPKRGEGWDVGFYESDSSKYAGEHLSCTWYAVGALHEALAVIAEWRVG